MRQYVQVNPWSPSLSNASTSTACFKALGMMSAINFWYASMTYLYNNPLMCVNKLASCFGALPFHNCFEMHLQNASFFCIWSKALCLLVVRGFGAISWEISTVVKSGVTVSLVGWGFEGSMSVVVWCWCDVLLLVWNAGPPEFILTVALLSFVSLTNLERQSAALFPAPDIHSNVIL